MTADTPAASKDATTDEAVEKADDVRRLVEAFRDCNPIEGTPAHWCQTLARHVATLTAKLEAERAKVAKAEEMAFVPGRWRCAKCDFFLTSTNLHVSNGTMSPNNEPHACPNNCGPMWRVSERDERKEAQRSFIDLHEKSTRETARADAAVAEAKALREAAEQAYGYLWVTSAMVPKDDPVSLARKRLLDEIGGWNSAGQRRGIAFATDQFEVGPDGVRPKRATLAQPADGGK